jgi:predicted CxxxxCH...CXXCH cytochrome family protein
MSQIISVRKFSLLLTVVFLAVVGCGTPNDQNGFDADTQKHIADWVVPKHAPMAQADVASCMGCHGEDLLGGISGKSCTACHLNGMVALTGCTSCHGKPPTGGVAPNRIGTHPSHNALPRVTNVCDTCHSGAGTTTARHFNGAVDVSFLSVYNAQSGTAARNADGTCSAVSCHGGQTTPAWMTGLIDVNTQCDSCHAFGSAEYNSFISGRHDSHVNTFGFECTRCHSTSRLAISHFTSLNTSIMEGPASATLNSSLTYTGGSCTPLCHDTRSW